MEPASSLFGRRDGERDRSWRLGTQRVFADVKGWHRRGRIARGEDVRPFRRSFVPQLDGYRRSLRFQTSRPFGARLQVLILHLLKVILSAGSRIFGLAHDHRAANGTNSGAI